MFIVKSKHDKMLFKKVFMSYNDAEKHLHCFVLASGDRMALNRYWIVPID